MNVKTFAVVALFLSTLLHASSRIEVNAQNIHSSDGSVKASEDVVAFVNGSMVASKNASYYKDSSVMLLRDNVEILEYDSKNIASSKIYMNTKEDNASYEDIFITTQEDFWLYSDKIDRKGDQYLFGPSIFSSCGIKNPDWIMACERSKYDANSSRMKVYNAKVYAKEIPVFYFPYLSFSTKQERSSGFLF
ncbi:MAG: hypothetical protein U9N49_06650, partial [Campylobacterota bacterium]|nr:hypothetical protein [Campylobacterota bacterium]